MLKTKSFKFEEHEEINELLTTFRLAAGASIFVSDSKVLIPYDDGEPANNAQRIIDLKLQINEMNDQKVVLLHSIKVVENMSKQLAGKLLTAEADLAEAEAMKNSKGKTHKIKTGNAVISHINDQKLENGKAIRQNLYEVSRLDG